MQVSRCKRVNKFFVQPIASPCTTFYHMLWLTYPPLQQQWCHAINYGERYLRLTWFLFYHNRTTLLWILQANWSLIWAQILYEFWQMLQTVRCPQTDTARCPPSKILSYEKIILSLLLRSSWWMHQGRSCLLQT